MLDAAMIEQLKSVFQDLPASISLKLADSKHEKNAELVSMLEGLAEASDKISISSLLETSAVPYFEVYRNEEPTGIAFKGIPGGHEFTSLVLAILNSCGKGKLPDEGIQARIRRLDENLEVRTYVSLSCENCPDVVQALNQIALFHPSLKHTMIEGSMVEDELKSLNIQGVPTVMVGTKMIHSGKASLAELLTKLKNEFKATNKPEETENLDLGHVDVLVVGGGPAGVSSAIYSVRKGLKTALVAEKMGGQVQDTVGIENMVSTIYTEGPQLSANLEAHLRSYPVSVLEHRRVVAIEIVDSKKKITMSSGEFITTDSLILATGAKWRELGVEGEKDYLGRGVAYCPHCDGPYYKGKKVAVVGGGNSGVEAAIDLAGICSEVVLFEYADSLKADQVLVEKLKTLKNTTIITNAKTKQVLGDSTKVTGIFYEDMQSGQDKRIELDGIFVQIGLVPNSEAFKELVEVNRYGEILVDEKGRTSQPGIYAAGDVTTTPYKQIIIAMGEGAKVALSAFEDRMRA